MILIDSSAWIEYYRSSGEHVAQMAVAEAIEEDQAAVNGIIRVEILGFAPDELQLRRLTSDFDAYHDLPLGSEDFDLASSIGFDLRRQGITVPATDLIIAACAIRADATLYHLDHHFEHIASTSDLDQEALATTS